MDLDLPSLEKYSVAFVNKAHIHEQTTARWIEALKIIRNEQKATIEEMEQAVEALHKKKFHITGPWSVINAVSIVQADKARNGAKPNGSLPEGVPGNPGETIEETQARMYRLMNDPSNLADKEYLKGQP